MYKYQFFLFTLFLFSSIAIADNGLIHVKSTFDVPTTANRYEATVKAKGMTVFIRVNHARGAASIGKNLRPTELIIFGSPKVGTALMQCQQSSGIDLPLKTLIWEDENGITWISYSKPIFLAQRHSIIGCDNIVKKMTSVLQYFATSASKADK